MNERVTPEQLRELSISERLQLLEDVWKSLIDDPDGIAMPAWHQVEHDARLAERERDPTPAMPWPDVKTDHSQAPSQMNLLVRPEAQRDILDAAR